MLLAARLGVLLSTAAASGSAGGAAAVLGARHEVVRAAGPAAAGAEGAGASGRLDSIFRDFGSVSLYDVGEQFDPLVLSCGGGGSGADSCPTPQLRNVRTCSCTRSTQSLNPRRACAPGVSQLNSSRSNGRHPP